MAKYVAMYRCRQCNDMVEGAITNKENANLCMYKVLEVVNKPIPQAPCMIEVHYCETGDIGIMDFQGFHKVGD